MKSRKRNNKSGRVCSIIGTTVIVVVIVLCSLLVFPGIFGFHTYHVISGSMEPTIKIGSLIYVKEGSPEEVKADDIIAFYGSLDDSGIITHRVTANNIVSGILKTKGDANAGEDPSPVSYDNYIGNVVLTIPYVGQVLTVMTSFYGKIAAALTILLGAVLNFVGGRLGK